jgi:hypothetical protein
VVLSAFAGQGYVVPDGQSSQPLDGDLALSRTVYPGPTPDSFWVGSTNPSSLESVDIHGNPSGGHLSAPAGNNGSLIPDNSGDVLLAGDGGVYLFRNTVPHRVATGHLVAIGPTGWLVQDCADDGACVTELLAAASGRKTLVSFGLTQALATPGAIAPDGTRVAVLLGTPGDPAMRLVVVDVATGGTHEYVGLFGTADPTGRLVWSPDSKWLFVVDSNGHLHTIDATGQEAVVALPVPFIYQVAVRAR